MTKTKIEYCPHGYLRQAASGLPLTSICNTCAEKPVTCGPASLALRALNVALEARRPRAQSVAATQEAAFR